jgi:hypothetical protein
MSDAAGSQQQTGMAQGETGAIHVDRHTASGWIMIQCDKCELCEIGPDGRKMFKCDPFSSVKEAECIAKWQLIRLDMLLGSYQSMLKWYSKLGPLQDKIFKYVQREISDIEESEGWKLDEPPEGEEDSDTAYPV